MMDHPKAAFQLPTLSSPAPIQSRRLHCNPVLLLAAAICFVVFTAFAPKPPSAGRCREEYQTGSQNVQNIVPGANWTDTSGNIIQAHGAGIIKVDDTWWWFGEDKRENNQYFLGIGCYSSRDLQTWTKHDDVLTSRSGTPLNSSMVVERPKVIYNAATSRYVMYFHYDTTNYGLAEVGVAVSSRIDRGWEFVTHFKPLGTDSRDMSLYQDTDGSAYLIFASDGNANFKIAQLSSDYLNVARLTYQWTNVYWEAAGVIKRDGTYYMIFSTQSGWSPNANQVVTAPSLGGPWSDRVGIAPAALRTYSSQNAYDITVEGSETISYIYVGDRWRSDVLGTSTYIWLPITIRGGVATLVQADVWSIDVNTGAYTVATGTRYDASAALTYTGGAYYSNSMVRYLGGGGTVTFTGIASPRQTAGEHWVAIYSSNGDSGYRTIRATANGGALVTMPQPPTGGGTNLLSVPVKMTLRASNNAITFQGTASTYAADLAYIVVY